MKRKRKKITSRKAPTPAPVVEPVEDYDPLENDREYSAAFYVAYYDTLASEARRRNIAIARFMNEHFKAGDDQR